ncbi:hypothetical protein DMC30DRAFT_350120 [Rhodotorula diobovata]|uniref:Uncharacterized protein n=1 Tax=Rhodotorula diobovata TaxID=5288 RepID=A0A5C5FY69_9BASI|nr:hypothetical protein DMC30DRAFT_350120 [Rhodotorula diobovata]
MKRTPSLSIVIPTAAPSSSSSSAAPHPHVRLPPETDDPRPSVPRSARGAAAARPSPTSASSGAPPHSPWTPRTRRASQPVPGAGAGAGGGGGASPWSTRPPRTPYPKRPAMAERTPSASTMATYTSFDLQAPRTPAEERERRDAELRRSERGWRWCGRWLSGRGRDDDDEYADNEFRAGDEEEQRGAAAPAETTALLENRASGRKEGQTRTQYILAETWCYAKHMLPPILFFVVLVLVVALAAYRQAVSRIIHPPHP